MENKGPYALVGLFVCITLAALVGFSVWIEGGNDKNFDNYTVYFDTSVSGLEEGAQVEYRGVNVGKVQTIRLAKEKETLVKVDISVRNDTPIHGSTKAQLAMAGVTGLVHMSLLPATKGDKTDPVVVEGEPYPVLEGQESEISKALKDVKVITNQMKNFSGGLNERMEKFDNSFVGRMLQ